MRFDAQDGLHLRKIITKQNTSGPMLKESSAFQSKKGREKTVLVRLRCNALCLCESVFG